VKALAAPKFPMSFGQLARVGIESGKVTLSGCWRVATLRKVMFGVGSKACVGSLGKALAMKV